MFKHRSDKKELLDGDHIAQADLYRNLKELHIINSFLGGYRVSVSAIRKAIPPEGPVNLLDLGCGGGDTLKFLLRTKDLSARLKLYGIDYNSTCISYCHNNDPEPAITFINDDFRNAPAHINDITILHASLFCHHLKEEEIIELIRFARQNKSILVINDLERNVIAYYSIRVLTRLFSKSYLVKNDAPLSVLRGFKKREWLDMIRAAGATKFCIKWKWAFRHEVIVYG